MTVMYGKLSSEERASQLLECRNIVRAVIDHGLSNDQILALIRFFALELENHEHSVAVVSLMKEIEQDAGSPFLAVHPDEEGA